MLHVRPQARLLLCGYRALIGIGRQQGSPRRTHSPEQGVVGPAVFLCVEVARRRERWELTSVSAGTDAGEFNQSGPAGKNVLVIRRGQELIDGESLPRHNQKIHQPWTISAGSARERSRSG